MEITKTELKKKTRGWLKRKGLNCAEYMRLVGGERRYFVGKLNFLRAMEKISGTAVRQYLDFLEGRV